MQVTESKACNYAILRLDRMGQPHTKSTVTTVACYALWPKRFVTPQCRPWRTQSWHQTLGKKTACTLSERDGSHLASCPYPCPVPNTVCLPLAPLLFLSSLHKADALTLSLQSFPCQLFMALALDLVLCPAWFRPIPPCPVPSRPAPFRPACALVPLSFHPHTGTCPSISMRMRAHPGPCPCAVQLWLCPWRRGTSLWLPHSGGCWG